MKRWLAGIAALLLANASLAHRASDGFMSLAVEGSRVTGQVELALRDLALLVPLDANGDGALSWGEVRLSEGPVRAALESGIAISADGVPCPATTGPLALNDRSDGIYLWLPVTAECAAEPGELGVAYTVLFAIDPSHRGLLTVVAGPQTHGAVFEPERTRVGLRLAEPARWRQFLEYLREGVHHIWIGADHILFLVALLLPCVLVRAGGAWTAAPALRPVVWDVFRVVTAFTLAHSVTLGLSALGLLSLPAAPVETLIALSVVCAALNNLRPLVTASRWKVALGFGLVHGFGFATVLGEMGLPAGARAVALAGFNAGVELGQLAIVAAVVPAIFAVRRHRAYLRLMQAGSAIVALWALWWAAERSGLA